VIPVHNEEKSIAACLESVLKDSYYNKEIIVVDDASTDHTSDILKRFPVTVVRNRKTMGPSSARNIGVAKVAGEIIIFIDAHCIITDPNWIQKFLQYLEDPHVGAVAGYFKPQPRGRGLTLTFKSPKPEQRLIKSGNAAFRKTVFSEVGGFDHKTEWAGDAVLTYKIQKTKWKILHTPDITVTHTPALWPIKRAFTYGTCYFPLLVKYPRETIARSRPIVIGLFITLGIILDLIYRLPLFTAAFTLFLIVLNGLTRNLSIPRIFKQGLYSTAWAFAYYLGAIIGIPKYLSETAQTSVQESIICEQTIKAESE
jgi:glycosyltransferase involved in cell wall biosynthesis